MAYEDPRKVERDKLKDHQETRKPVDRERAEEDWDNQDDCNFRYTDWASI